MEMEYHDQGPFMSDYSTPHLKPMIFYNLFPYAMDGTTNKDIQHEVSLMDATA